MSEPTKEQIEAANGWMLQLWPNTHNNRPEVESLASMLASRESAARAEERAACARIADGAIGNPAPHWPGVKSGESWNAACLRIAAAIRARGRE